MKKLFIALALPVLWTAAHAMQVVDVVDGATVFVKISAKDQTRLRVDGGRIASLRLPRGQLVMEPDDETGQVFITVPETTKGPVHGYLTTEAGQTVTITLVPADIPIETIVFRPPTPPVRNPQAPFGRNGNPFEKDIKRLYGVMLNGEALDGVEVREVQQPIALWKEASMVLERQFLTPTVLGECFRVTNVSKAQMVLGEQEFYRRGVNTVAIEQHNLAPGADTKVCLIRDKSVNE